MEIIETNTDKKTSKKTIKKLIYYFYKIDKKRKPLKNDTSGNKRKNS